MPQDSIDVFPNPVDSLRIPLQEITSEKVTKMMDWHESIMALWNVVEWQYIVLVCVVYYIVVTRMQFIRTNSYGRRNALMLILTITGGLIGFFWLDQPAFDLLVSGLLVNSAYEYLFKAGFKGLEKVGWTPLPQWHVEEIREEKQKDIQRAEQVKKTKQ